MADVRNLVCGVADEAGSTLEEQIRAHRDLGWSLIELRSIGDVQITDLPEEAFQGVLAAVRDGGLSVVALDTRIGGWGRTIDSPFDHDIEELRRAADRAHRLGARMLRVMSYPNAGLAPNEWRLRSLERVAVLADEARSADALLVHENCQGWASQGPEQTLDMLRTVASPHLRLLFDIGNPVAYRQDGPEFLARVLPWVAHVHVKDAVASEGRTSYVYPGLGQAAVRECLRLLHQGGYRNAFSIEPHLAYVPHTGLSAAPEERCAAYLRYGQCFERLLDEIMAQGESVPS